MSSDTNTARCHKVRRLEEVKVVVEPANSWSRSRDLEEHAKWLEAWARELMAFFRDHRHQDVNDVSVDRTYIDACSACGREWEEFFDEDTGATCCTNCGVEMEVVR